MQTRSPTRRSLISGGDVVQSVTVGIVVAILIAWMFAILGPDVYPPTDCGDAPLGWARTPPADWGPPLAALEYRTRGIAWHAAQSDTHTMWVWTFGWPWKCLDWELSGPVTQHPQSQRRAWHVGDGLPIAKEAGPQPIGLVRRLPLRILPLGLILDAALYAGLTLLFMSAQRIVRRERGACVHCNYSCAGLPTCPECGALQHRKPSDPA